MGGFLCPPGHPTHSFSAETGRRDNPNGCYSLESAIDQEWLPADIRGRARGILERWEREKKPLTDPEVQEWVLTVLGYFKGCYRGQDKEGNPSWNASDLRIDSGIDPVLNADLHAGVHLIRKYYPEFVPTAEHFKGAYWGQKPVTA